MFMLLERNGPGDMLGEKKRQGTHIPGGVSVALGREVRLGEGQGFFGLICIFWDFLDELGFLHSLHNLREETCVLTGSLTVWADILALPLRAV